MTWSRVRLGDEVTAGRAIVQTGPFGSQLHQHDYVDDGVPVVMPKDIVDGDIDLTGIARVGDAKAQELARHLLAAGDIVFPRRGDIRKCALVTLQTEGAMCGTGCLKIRVDRSIFEPRFLYYVMSSDEVGSWLEGRAVGTTMLNLSAGILNDLEVPTPPLRVQDAIVSTVSAYDDLIDNNRRRIKLLEDSARLLFDEWFVRLRFPGHGHSRVSEGVPDGWVRSSLGQVVRSLEDGDWIESKDQGGGDFRILQISNVGLNDFRETGNLRFITEETFRRLRCRELTSGMLLIARMPTPIGRAMMVTEMPWRMVTAVDVAIVDPDDDLLDRHYLLYHLNSAENLARCEGRTVGATRPRVTRRELAELPLLVPDRRTQQAFREVAADVQAQRHILSRQIDKLRTARDLLMPRLLSGELTV